MRIEHSILGILVALGLAACEAPTREQSGFVSENAQDELIDDEEEERIGREQDAREQRAREQPPLPPEQRTPDIVDDEGPEEALGAGGSRDEELVPAEQE